MTLRINIPRGTWLPILVVLALIIFFGIASPPFLSWRNFSAINGEAATLLIASLGASFVILMGSIDLSVGAIVLFVGAVSITILTSPYGANYGLLILPLGAALGAFLGETVRSASSAVCRALSSRSERCRFSTGSH
jgi:ribose transport system permease protein